MNVWTMNVDKRMKYAPLLLATNHEWEYGEAYWNVPPKTSHDIYLRTGREVSPWFDFGPMKNTCKRMDKFDVSAYELLIVGWW